MTNEHDQLNLESRPKHIKLYRNICKQNTHKVNKQGDICGLGILLSNRKFLINIDSKLGKLKDDNNVGILVALRNNSFYSMFLPKKEVSKST